MRAHQKLGLRLAFLLLLGSAAQANTLIVNTNCAASPVPGPVTGQQVTYVDQNGNQCVSLGTLSAPQLLTTASANFTVPAGITLLRGAMAAAGGGGGGVSAATATAAAGLPGVMLEFVMVATPGQVIAYTNGAAGTRGANTGGAGGDGGDTTFGTLTAKGGIHGLGSTSGNAAATTAPNAGANGTGPLGMLTGSAAVPTTSTFIVSQSATAFNGTAGASGTGGTGKGIWGSSTPGTNGSAVDCVGYGAGGSGAGSTTNTAGTGALGCPGAVMLW
jgi:hypothetical protein